MSEASAVVIPEPPDGSMVVELPNADSKLPLGFWYRNDTEASYLPSADENKHWFSLDDDCCPYHWSLVISCGQLFLITQLEEITQVKQ